MVRNSRVYMNKRLRIAVYLIRDPFLEPVLH